MGQPAHPQGTRVSSIQMADNAVSWDTREQGYYSQSYTLALLFKFIRHWLHSSLVIPHGNPWFNNRYTYAAKLRSRKAVVRSQPMFPLLQWDNNLPKPLRKNTSGRIFDGIVIRYFRQLPPRLVLRDSTENLVRPVINLRRHRYTFTIWSRPKIIRFTQLIFCILKGLGAGEKTPTLKRSRLWRAHVQKRGLWKKLPPLTLAMPTPQTLGGRGEF